MGVLTHLDQFKDSKRLQKTKKGLKQRFWTEIYQGAKLFYLSGLINGKYPKNEIMNLARFISVMKFRPLNWRNTHSYILADRFEDMTDPEVVRQNQKVDRKVCLYGYLRGTNLKKDMRVHIPGVGDHVVSDISALPEPCPLPEKVRKSLSEKQKMIYAPMSSVSGVLYDKDAVYVNVPGIFSKDSELEKGEGEQMVFNLQETNNTLSEQIEKSSLRVFADSKPILGNDSRVRRKVLFGDKEDEDMMEVDEEEDGDSEAESMQEELDSNASDEEEEDFDDLQSVSDDEEGHVRLREEKDDMGQTEEIAYADSDSQMSDDDEDFGGALNWKADILKRAEENFLKHKKRKSLVDIIYGDDDPYASDESENEEEKQEDTGEDLFRLKKKTKTKKIVDSSKIETEGNLSDVDQDFKDLLKSRFIPNNGNEAGGDDAEGSDKEVYGDFEDLETGEVHKGDEEGGASEKEEGGSGENEEDLSKKKEDLKRKFDAEYDGSSDEEGPANLYEQAKADMSERAVRNATEFENLSEEQRVALEGYRAGKYVRIVIENFPCEFVENFDPAYPIVIGSVAASESAAGLLQLRLKRHRWYPKILKTNNPLIISMGWRRFQVLPTYSISDGTRNRLLKYTPEHLHCLATVYAPYAPPNTGFCAFETLSDQKVHLLVFYFQVTYI